MFRILLVASLALPLHAAEFVLVAPDTPPAPIILAPDATPRTREAARVLADRVHQICGQKPALLDTPPATAPERAIWIGLQPAVKPLFPSATLDFTQPEEILITATEKHLLIAGRDRWDPAKPDIETRYGLIKNVQQEYGTINAIHTFLQDQLGIRWFWPGDLGEDAPKQQRIAIPLPLEHRYHPQIRARGTVFNYSSLGNKGYGVSHEWTLRQRLQLCSLSIDGGHGFTEWWDRYHLTHPEIFALQPDGTRSGFSSPRTAKLCTSNPKVWDLWLRQVADELKADPHRTVFNASPNDGWASGFCVCEKCRAWDPPEGSPRLFNWKNTKEMRPATSDRDVFFANKLAELLEQKYPGKGYKVMMISYGNSRPVPAKARPAPNVIISLVANFLGRTTLTDRGAPGKETYRQQFEAWAKILPVCFWRPNTGSPAGWQQGLPDLSVTQTIRDFKDVAAANCIGIYIDGVWEHWAALAPQYYIMAQLAWNPKADAAAILDDYYRRAFGPAAPHVREYFEALEAARMAFCNANPEAEVFAFPQLYTQELLAASTARLERAAAAAAAPADSIFAKRVAFIRSGLDYTKLQVANIVLMDRFWNRRDKSVADQSRQLWAQMEQLAKQQPYAINWPTIRPTTPRMAGLHPDGNPPKKKNRRAAELDL